MYDKHAALQYMHGDKVWTELYERIFHVRAGSNWNGEGMKIQRMNSQCLLHKLTKPGIREFCFSKKTFVQFPNLIHKSCLEEEHSNGSEKESCWK